MVFRPATPGFVVTLAATVCLAIVSFGVPLLKSIYFLSASIDYDGLQGTATFGVLGYCLEAGGTKACSNATVGWEFDPNALLSLDLPLDLEIPNVVVKWLTYVLVLHIVGLGLAAIASLFGLLAHIREMAMTCFSTCISGTAAAVVLVAFIFDIVFFLVIRARVQAVGGSASLGNALWLTLSAWLMLFFAGFFFGIGKCCFASRPRGPKNYKKGGYFTGPAPTGDISQSEAMRLEAIKAENERKARQAESGLPAFPTGPEERPLNKPNAQYYVEEDSEDEATKPAYVPAGHPPQRRGSAGTTTTAITTNYTGRGRQETQTQQPQYSGGYLQATPGTRTVDQYQNPNPYRQPSTNSGYNFNQTPSSSSPPPMPQANTYLTPGAANDGYFHAPHQTSYHSAVSHQAGQASSYSQFDQSYNTPGNGATDAYYTQQNQPPQQQQYTAAYPPAVAQQPFGDATYGSNTHNNSHGQQQQPYAPYTDPYTRAQSPPQQPQYSQQYSQPYDAGTTNAPAFPPGMNYADAYAVGQSRRSPTSPTGPRPMGSSVPPWQGQGPPIGSVSEFIDNFSSTPAPMSKAPVPPPKDTSPPGPSFIPSEAPPSYELPPGTAPPGAWPKEKK